ncbi:MAG: capsule assembly Wzi family protein [Sphingobacteriia bacterium]
MNYTIYSKFNFFFFLLINCFITNICDAQTVGVRSLTLNDQLRVLQLSGKLPDNFSLSILPLNTNSKISTDSIYSAIDNSWEINNITKAKIGNIVKIQVLPVSITTKFNSHHPYGWNDAGMIMAKGLQTMTSAGIYAELGPLSVQLQPEHYYAANPKYPITNDYGSSSNLVLNKLYLGQSAVRLNFGALSLGVSSENLWWGPGQFSSLLMSNNAPGFQHVTFNSRRPVKTVIGSFEWQLVLGKLNEDTAGAFENRFLQRLDMSNNWRYFNGLIVTYQPSWLRNFFLGVIRTEQLYNTDLKRKSGFFNKYLPVFSGSSSTDNGNTNTAQSDGAFSFFTRWIIPKHNAEFYVEYGYNDFKQNFRDFATNANHSSAYIIGFNKLILDKSSSSIKDKNKLKGIFISGELTQMAQTTSYVVRSAGNWYTHVPILQGYTNQNQIMGAGSGVGNNVQTIQVKRINGFTSYGVKLQRIQQDPKGINGPMASIGMRDFQWNDMAIGFLGQKKWKKLMVTGELQFVNSKNYAWKKGNAFNFFTQVNASYFF